MVAIVENNNRSASLVFMLSPLGSRSAGFTDHTRGRARFSQGRHADTPVVRPPASFLEDDRLEFPLDLGDHLFAFVPGKRFDDVVSEGEQPVPQTLFAFVEFSRAIEMRCERHPKSLRLE